MSDYVYYIGDYWTRNDNEIFKITNIETHILIGNIYIINKFKTYIAAQYLKNLHCRKEWQEEIIINKFGLFCYNCNMFYNNANNNIISRIRGKDFICWRCDDKI